MAQVRRSNKVVSYYRSWNALLRFIFPSIIVITTGAAVNAALARLAEVPIFYFIIALGASVYFT